MNRYVWTAISCTLLFALVVMSGCSTAHPESPATPSLTPPPMSPAFTPATTAPSETMPPTESPQATTQAAVSTVSRATPIPPPEPNEVPAYFVQNSPQYNANSQDFVSLFQERFSLRYQSEAVQVDLIRSPMLVDFTVSAGSSNPNLCFFIITIRDATTGTVLAQEGYARTYSTQATKRLVISAPGRYHINLYGNMVEVDLTIRGGR